MNISVHRLFKPDTMQIFTKILNIYGKNIAFLVNKQCRYLSLLSSAGISFFITCDIMYINLNCSLEFE